MASAVQVVVIIPEKEYEKVLREKEEQRKSVKNINLNRNGIPKGKTSFKITFVVRYISVFNCKPNFANIRSFL